MADVEIYGVDVDWEPMERHRALYKPFASRMEQAVKEGFAQLVKDPQTRENVANLNLGSAPQMQKLLYEDIGWRATRFSRKTGKPSADKIALESLSRKYPAVKRLLQLREMNNLGIRHETWLDEYRDSYDRKVHPNYSQVRVPSGRFAAEKPAIQQLPKHWYWDIRGPQETEDDVRASCTNGDRYWEGWFRKYIIASPNHYLLTYDYSQVELRVLAAVSKEERLLQAFDQDEDVHVTTTAQMLGLSRDEVTDELRQIGKAQPLDAQVLTPDGWRKMGDIHVGDFVIGSDGQAVAVTGVFPQGVRKVYEVETSDGAVTQCCEEHLWTVQSRNSKRRLWKTYELKEIVRRGLFNAPAMTKGKSYRQPKWMLPPRPVVEFAPLAEPLKVDPYVLGALLGDGSFRHDGVMFASADQHLLDAVLAEADRLGSSVSSHFERDGVKGFYIFGNGKRGGNPLKEALKDYGLWRTTSSTKFIPEPYLRATPAERLALLQGLMDTDGNVQASGGQFRSVSEALAGGVQELARSLGGFASMRTREPVPNALVTGRLLQYDCYFTLPIGVNPFQLERKAIKARKYASPPTIRRVTEVGEKQTQCISVASENGLYLTDEYIVTHNTLNFAILYGMGVKSLGERMAVTTERAQELYTSYFQQFSSIDDWVSKTRKAGIKNKYVETFFGRRIPLWDLLSDKEGVRKKGERVAINGPVQGGAADYMKYAMVRAKRMLEKEGLWNNGVMITMNQHDSLTFEVRNDIDPNWLRGKLAEAVVFVIPGFPKIVADWEIGVSWGASTKWKDQQAIFDGTTWVVEGAEAVLSASESFGDDYDVEWGEDEDGEWDDVVEIEVDDSGVPTLVVTCAQPPTQARLQEFLTLVRSAPGDKALEFVVAGRCIPLALMTSLSAGDAGRLSLALGGAEVAETVRVRDLEAATAGLSL